jgi:hypothetical protein
MHQLNQISQSLERIASQGEKPFYFTSEFITAIGILVAILLPWLLYLKEHKQKRSKLIFVEEVISQDSNPDTKMEMGRLIIANQGNKAVAVEAYIEKIEGRKDFIAMPLAWTHRPADIARDIYYHQTVRLDIFKFFSNPTNTYDSILLQVTVGAGVKNLSEINPGKSEFLLRIYQENGQVDEVTLVLDWKKQERKVDFKVKRYRSIY